MILALKTNNDQAELHLFSDNELQYKYTWSSKRQLANELLPKLQEFLLANNYELNNLTGIIIYTGDGSFTGIRIGTTVANTLAYSYKIPVVESTGSNWLKKGLEKLKNSKPNVYVVPKYSSPPNITKPKA